MNDVALRTVEEHFDSFTDGLRPLITSLNGHNSWLLSLPRPEDEQIWSGRSYFQVVLDPWLAGPANLVGSWLIHVDIPATPALRTAAAVEEAARQIETIAARRITRRRYSNEVFNPAKHIDAILLSFHYYDHVHEETLCSFEPSIPVIATREAASMIKPWKHFINVATVPDFDMFDGSWESHPVALLPAWLSTIRLPGHRAVNFCLAIVWTHWDWEGNAVHEAIFTSPHGLLGEQGSLWSFIHAEPPIIPLAMLHGLKESHIGGKQISLGAKGGLSLYRELQPAYWILSHDLMLKYTGIFMKISRTSDTRRTLEWALGEEKGVGGCSDKDDVGRKPVLTRVPNGRCFVLEA